MPDSLPAIPGAKVVRALERAGFTVVRISGSHHVMRHPDGSANRTNGLRSPRNWYVS
jgi:predicted RNA binding protein YcfA (HicA-like mRNA interferase family)